MNELPEPETEAFNKLGPQARTLARWKHSYTPITQSRSETRAQATLNQVTPNE